MMLQPANPVAAIAAQQASFRRMLAANGRALSARAAAKTGEIAGTVVGRGKPLGGICVRVLPVKSGHPYAAKTSKNGTYTVRNLAPGQYHVVFASVFTCPSRANWLQQVYKDVNDFVYSFNNSGTAVRVNAGHKTAGISGNLQLGGEISGTVTGESGARLRGICIFAGAALAHHRGYGFGSQTTANGSFQLHALFPGKYTLRFSIGCGSGSENYAPATHAAVKVGLAQNLTVNEVMPTGASISGTVTLGSSSGTPLQGICVSAFDPRPFGEGFTSTDSNGDYRVIGLTGGSYELQFFPGCRNNGNFTSTSLTADTTAGQQTSNVNAVLQVGGEITGTITDGHGHPVPGICAEVIGNDSVGGAVFGDHNGSYVIDQLPAGTYQVGFFGGCGNSGSYAPYWYDNQPSENTATPISLATGQTFTVDAALRPGATITGKATDAAGKGLSGICVNAAMRSEAHFGPFFGAQTGTNHGRYTLSNLAPGQYLIDFGCGFGGRYGNQWFPGAPDAGAAEFVSAPAGRTSGINAVLRPGGSIRGVVTGQAGHPVAGVCVAAVNTKGTLPALRGISSIGFLIGRFGIGGATQVGITGPHGAFDISGLAAGRYQVSFSQCFPPRRYAWQWYRGKSSASAATDVTVRAGKAASGIDAHLVLGGTISGRVVNASGKPLSNICILATNQSTNVVVGAVPGRGGTYTIPSLSSGRYTVEFSPCGNQNLVTVVAHVRVTAPHTTAGVNVTLRSGGSIAGNVSAGSSGPAVSNTCVEVYGKNSAQPAGFGFTGLDGSYLASGLAAGTYQVYFGDPNCLFTAPGLAPGWYNDQATQGAATPVNVTVGATTPSIDAALQPDGKITGTVSGSSGSPLSGACVTAIPLSAGVSLPVVAVTRPGGYTLADLLPGQYKVRFSSGCGAIGYATQWYRDKASRKIATVITVGADQTMSGVSATLSKG
jgi:Carboxypeptidase regulatory-like domain